MNISWTRFRVFKECTLEYDLQYQKHYRVRESRPIFLVGSVVHNVMKLWADSGFRNDYVKKIIGGAFRNEARGLSVTPERKEELLKLSAKGSLLAEKIYRRLGVIQHNSILEDSFRVPISPDMLIGSIDIFDPENQYVYDLKMYTTEVTDDTYQIGQLYSYAIAKNAQGFDIKKMGYITPLLEKKVHIFDVDKAELEKQRVDLLNAAQSMVDGVQPKANVGKHCFFCQFYNTSYCSATYTKGDTEKMKFNDPGKVLKMMEKME